MGRVNELVEYLRGSVTLDVVCHDNPDPDCIASAAALKWIAEHTGVSNVQIKYGGQISHQQNRAMVRKFGLELVPIGSASSRRAELVAFVDHALPGGYTQLPREVDVDIVIDHHAYDEPVYANFVDLRPNYGATSSILVEYLRAITYPLPVPLASMLLFAIHRERLDHVRNPTHHEYESALPLQTHASQTMIDELYGTQYSPATLNAIGDAIHNRRVRGSSLVSWVGRIAERDALPQSADYLINLSGVDNDLVFGLVEDVIHLSARSQDPTLRLDRVLRDVVGGGGRAGGHGDMAGGQIPIERGLPAGRDASAIAEEFVEPITERFFSAVESNRPPHRRRRPQH